MASEYPDVVFAKVDIQKAKVRNYKYLTSFENETKGKGSSRYGVLMFIRCCCVFYVVVLEDFG